MDPIVQSLLTSAPFAGVFLYGLIHVFRTWQADVKALLAEQERVRSGVLADIERVRNASQAREDARNKEWIDFLRQLVDDGRRDERGNSHDAPAPPHQ